MTGKLHSSSSAADCGVDILRHIYCEFSSRPSSVTDEELQRFLFAINKNNNALSSPTKHPAKTLSLPNLSSVVNTSIADPTSSSSSGGASVSSRAKELMKKCMKNARIFIGKLSPEPAPSARVSRTARASSSRGMRDRGVGTKKDHYVCTWRNLSGSCKSPAIPRRGRSCISSCATSSSSPCRSAHMKAVRVGPGLHYSDPSSVQEVQDAIQGAIAHCKNSMKKNDDSPMGDSEVLKI